MNYYNEFNADAAQWMQNLMDAGHIPRGHIDTRSIEDVKPIELAGYTQCHFFTGVGGWPLALRLAGWPDSRPIWTGSCPCQPFSSAGKGGGFDDQRHLWPAWLHLIRQCRPAIIVGEQVASPDALRWFDLVSADLEGSHYASGAADLCSAGIGAAHIRQRLYWMAYAERDGGARWSADKSTEGDGAPRKRPHAESGRCSNADRLAHPNQRTGRQGHPDAGRRDTGGDAQPRPGSCSGGEFGGMADSSESQRGRRAHNGPLQQHRATTGRHEVASDAERSGDACVWLPCIDGKSRPASAEPGAFPLAYGIPRDLGRVQPELAGMGRSAGRNRRIRLHGYGNAIDPRVAAEFMKCVMECLPC